MCGGPKRGVVRVLVSRLTYPFEEGKGIHLAQWTRVVTQAELTEAIRDYLIKRGDIIETDSISTSGGGVVMNIEEPENAKPSTNDASFGNSVTDLMEKQGLSNA